MIQLNLPVISEFICEHYSIGIPGQPPSFNVYDITKDYDYDWSRIGEFWKRQDVLKALNLTDRDSWVECNATVYKYFRLDFATSVKPDVEHLIKQNVYVMIYQGVHDYIVNWNGCENWVQHMEWEYQEEYNNQQFQDWTFEGEVHAQYKKVPGFSFVNVKNSGHMVPMDQPKFSEDLLQKFLNKF